MADKKKPYRFKGLQRVIRYGDDPINTQQKIHEPGIEQMQSDAALQSILQEGTPEQVVKSAGSTQKLRQFAQRRAQKQDLLPMQYIQAQQHHSANRSKAQKEKKQGMRAHARLTSRHPQFVVGNKTPARPDRALVVPVGAGQQTDDQGKIDALQRELMTQDQAQLGQQGVQMRIEALRQLYERARKKKALASSSNLDQLEVQR